MRHTNINIITYLVPVYATPLEWVRECMESLVAQTNQKFRIVVSNDASPNLSYIRDLYKYLWGISYSHFGFRLKITSTRKNMGLAGNNKYMIGLSHTKCVGLLDSDDAVTPETTQIITDTYVNSDSDFVYSNFNYCNDNLIIKYPGYCREIPQPASAGRLLAGSIATQEISPNSNILETNCVSHLKTFKVNSYHHTLGYDHTFRSAEDKDIIFKFEEAHMKFMHIPMKLYKYRQISNSLSRDSRMNLNDVTIQYTIDAIRDTCYRRNNNIALYLVWPKYKIDPMHNLYQRYFDDYFDQIYVINLQTRDSNLNNMILRLKLIGASKVTIVRTPHAKNIPELVDLYNFINSNPMTTSLEISERSKLIKTVGELGCIESHLICLFDADNKKYNRILILEDDVYFDKHFLIKFKEYTEKITDWLYLMLGSSQWSWWGNAPFIDSHSFHPTRASMGTFALGIDRQLIPDLINSLSMYTGPADLGGYLHAILPYKPNESKHSINYIYENRHPIDKCFVLYPNLIVADTRKSDIRSNYDSDMEWYERSKRMDWKMGQKNVVTCTHDIPHTYNMLEINNVNEMYSMGEQTNEFVLLEIDPDLLTPHDIFILRQKCPSIKFRISGVIPSNYTYYYYRIRDLICTQNNTSTY